MISHNHKCIFIHIPKCGGQSVEHVFLEDLGLGWDHRSPLLLRPNEDLHVGPPRLAHLGYKEYVKFCYVSKELWRQYFCFAIVRNPYTRIESLYKYLGYSVALSFDNFVCNWLPEILEGDMAWFLKPQIDYIIDEQGEIAVDEVIKLEHLNQDLPVLLARIGINLADIPHVNRSQNYAKGGVFIRRFKMLWKGVFEPVIKVDDKVFWTNEAREVINRLYKPDFELLNYEQFKY